MIGAWIIIAVVGAVCAVNYRLGRQWSRLDHNPWASTLWNGKFWDATPGFDAGEMSVEEIRKRGRLLMLAYPLIFVAVTVVVLIVFSSTTFSPKG